MKIAVDVKGTIEGHRREYIVEMIKHFQKLGHEVVVWSNSFSYSVACVAGLEEEYRITLAPGLKERKYSDEEPEFDIAIDDDTSQTWLNSKRIIFVRDLPESDAKSYVEWLVK